jgi:hypothetical protein
MPNVRGLDLSLEADREALREVMQTLYRAFAAGTLELQGLTRDEFLSLFDSMADSLNGFEEATRRVSRGLLNVPPIFDLALRRRMAALDGALGGIAAPPSGGAVKPGDGFIPPPVSLGMERFGDLLAGLDTPMAGLTDTITARWEQLTRLPALPTAAYAAVPGGGATGAVGTAVVNVHPGAIVVNGTGKDGRKVAQDVIKELAWQLRMGPNEITHAVGIAVDKRAARY